MDKKKWVLTGFICLKFFLQYILLSPGYDLQRDEYLHLDLGRHLAWGYESVPPITGWNSSLIALLGNSIFWIKFFPALWGALTMLLVWKITGYMKGGLYAQILAAICILFSVLLRLNTLYQPNSLDVFSWTLVGFFLIKYFSSDIKKYLYFSAIAFALGFLNKYNIIFLAAALFPAILLSKQRTIFFKKEFYYALLVALVLISPNLWWQYEHNFPVSEHMQELAETQLVNVSRSGFLKAQFFFFAGGIPVIFAGLWGLYFYKPFEKWRVYLGVFLFTLLLYIYFRAKDYYAIGLYPIYIGFGSVYLEKLLQPGWRRYLRPLFPAFPVLYFIPMFQFSFPNKSPEYMVMHSEIYRKTGQLRWEDGKEHLIPQDYADMLGWKELAGKVDSIYLRMPDPKRTLIVCDNYGQAGAINYYTQKSIKADSFNGDYIHWFDLKKKYIHLIRITGVQDADKELKDLEPYFGKAFLADSIANPFAREYRTKILVFSNAKININEVIAEEIYLKKKKR